MKFPRTNEGLRDAIMSEMEDIRAGIAGAPEAMAFAALAGRVIESLEADIAAQLRQDNLENRNYERARREKNDAIEQAREDRLLLTGGNNGNALAADADIQGDD